jgi:hypothetical protein
MFLLPALLVFFGLLVVLFWAMSPALAQAAALAMPSDVLVRPIAPFKPIVPTHIAPPSELLHSDELDGFEDETIDLQRVQGKIDKASVRKVEALVQTHRKEALVVIRGWMSENGH